MSPGTVSILVCQNHGPEGYDEATLEYQVLHINMSRKSLKIFSKPIRSEKLNL